MGYFAWYFGGRNYWFVLDNVNFLKQNKNIIIFHLLYASVHRSFAAAMSTKNKADSLHLFEGWAFNKKNYLLFLIGIVLIVLGYVIMGTGEVDSFQSLTIAPLMLFLGYIVIIPLALIYRDKNNQKNLGS